MAKVLVLNAGSSSLKYQVIDMENEKVLAKGNCEKVGLEEGIFSYSANGNKTVSYPKMENHSVALNFVLSAITDKVNGCIKSLDEIDAVGHRVLHGGETFSSAAKIDREVLAKIEDLIPLGPLHQPANLQGIYACQKLMPNVPQVAVFDTAFHSTMQPKAYRYALPVDDYKKYHIRKYGFHGTSHKYVSQKTAEYYGNKGKFIILHIGSGSSVSAVNNGICQDTSMGYTPLDGCLMGTRTGSIDPSVLPTLCEKHNMNLAEAINYLNKKSGLVGMTGCSDSRDVDDMANNKGGAYTASQVENAQLVNEMRAYRDAKIVGSYAAALNGVDAITFTAGVGEHDPIYRERVLGYLTYLGVVIDENKNKNVSEGEISAANSKVKVYVIPTNEELQIAKEAVEVLDL